MAYDRTWVISATGPCTFTVRRDGGLVTEFALSADVPPRITSGARAGVDTPLFVDFKRIVVDLESWFNLVVKLRALSVYACPAYKFECSRDIETDGTHEASADLWIGTLHLNAKWKASTDIVTVLPRGAMDISLGSFREWSRALIDLVTNVNMVEGYVRA